MLSRLQMPAGKAIALAAMPTAVLMGLGFTPQLANANPRAEERFKAGPCVTRSDEAARDGQEAEKDREREDGTAGDADTGPGGDAESGRGTGTDGGADPGTTEPDPPAGRHTPAPSPSAEPEQDAGDAGETGDGAGDGTGDEAGGTTEPAPPAPGGGTPDPEPEDPYNPLDPLGIGKQIEDLLTGGLTRPPATAPTAPATDPADGAVDGEAADGPAGTGKTTPGTTGKDPAGTGDEPGTADGTTGDARGEDAGDGEDGGNTGKGDAGQAPRDGEDAGDPENGEDGKDAEDGADGKDAQNGKDAEDAADEPSGTPEFDPDDLSGYPCPEFDAEAYENAPGETTEALLPDDPWVLLSSRLDLHGLAYDGIVEVKTSTGKVKKVLKFTATGIDIKDLHQQVVGPGGSTTHVEARKGSTSTITNGKVTMYTEELSGKLLGLLRVTFSPKSPPPLTLPELFFTDVKVVQAGQFGGDLTVPGMHLYTTTG
ncbi:hydrogenase expression protein HypF [Streptomyces pactum]|uniref:hydrogenase expression protein HypF n=1 Tax=Streptomyces pactum TaxID=68249 RepID=UPI0027DBC178|nr:hydrogenase expression protein HypF [Streptomyces pactum]